MSHVLCAMGLSAEESESSVRFSFGRFTSRMDITGVVERLSQVIEQWPI